MKLFIKGKMFDKLDTMSVTDADIKNLDSAEFHRQRPGLGGCWQHLQHQIQGDKRRQKHCDLEGSAFKE